MLHSNTLLGYLNRKIKDFGKVLLIREIGEEGEDAENLWNSRKEIHRKKA